MCHGARVRRALLCLLPCSLALLACGGDNSSAFLPFPDLCPVYAEQVCAARQACCELSEESVDCELRISKSCDAQRQQLSQEDGLRYEGVHAQEVREQQQAQLDACKPPYDLSHYFSEGAQAGAACERPTQCADGACVDGHCAAVATAPVCEL